MSSVGVYILIVAFVCDALLSEQQRKHINLEEFSKIYDRHGRKLNIILWIFIGITALILVSDTVDERTAGILGVVTASIIFAIARFRSFRIIKSAAIEGKYRKIAGARLTLSVIALIAVSFSYAV